MKIRTDFVTNSSSSSFVVGLKAELSDETTLELSSGEYTGDYENVNASFTVRGRDGEILYSGEVDPTNGDPFFRLPPAVKSAIEHSGALGPERVNLLGIMEAESVENLIMAIKRPFFGASHYIVSTDDEYECFDEEEEEKTRKIVEKTATVFNQVFDDCCRIMSEHIKAKTDLKNIAVTYDFGGSGEFLAGTEDILRKLFGWREGREIYKAIDQNDEDTAVKKLKQMDGFRNVDPESIKGFVSFVKECVDVPSDCTIVETINSDGKLHYDISYGY